jgi:hypothetical protein
MYQSFIYSPTKALVSCLKTILNLHYNLLTYTNKDLIYIYIYIGGKAMTNYPQVLVQDAVYQSHTGHMTGLWFLPTRSLRLNTNEWRNSIPIANWCQVTKVTALQLEPLWLTVCYRLLERTSCTQRSVV